MFQNQRRTERNFPMTAETAFIPVSLTETLQPPVLGRLVEYAANERLTHGQVIARALTQFFADKETSPPPPTVTAMAAAETATEGRAA